MFVSLLTERKFILWERNIPQVDIKLLIWE